MRKTTVLILILALAALPAACTNGGQNTPSVSDKVTKNPGPVYKAISPEEAKAIIGQENVVLVDVRTREEYAQSHIPQAVLLPLDSIKQDAESALPDQDAVIIVYCRSGNRSKTATNQLLDMGYNDVRDLGGIIDWPYETVSGS